MSSYFKTKNYRNWDKIKGITKNDNYIKENNMELSDLAYEIEELLGLELYDYGGSRVCLGIGDNKVLKIATSENGIISNYREANIYESLPEHLKKHFTKCFEVGDGYAVFEEVRGFLDFAEVERYKQEITSILEDIKKFPIKLNDIGIDTVIRNWGLRKDNTPVILDYAD